MTVTPNYRPQRAQFVRPDGNSDPFASALCHKVKLLVSLCAWNVKSFVGGFPMLYFCNPARVDK
jgi:hypothetical protein